MSWILRHQQSEQLASQADTAVRAGDLTRARSLYAQAAEAEERALDELDPTKVRTLGISAVSAVSLYYKAEELALAERLAHKLLATASLPGFAVEQLRSLVQAIWSEEVRARAQVAFAPGQVLISVRGGEIVEGGAPVDLILEKVQTVQALFYRTFEFLRGMPHRKHGAPAKDVLSSCRPWLFQASPGSYQFAVAVQEPKQGELFGAPEPRPKEVTERFLSILRAGAEAPADELPLLVPDDDYRSTFLKLTRNLAPKGTLYDQLEVRSAADPRPVTLVPTTRAELSSAIRSARIARAPSGAEEQTIKGVLRALHLDKDWMEVAAEEVHVRINDVGEAVDDVIGPLVNHAVVVQVVRDKHGKYRFRDIESDE